MNRYHRHGEQQGIIENNAGSKRVVVLTVTSACQTVIGCLSITLGVAAIVYCRVCASNSVTFQNDVCIWTMSSQGIWRGCMVALSGLAGIVQACIGKRCCNLTALILSSVAALVSLLATGIDVIRFLDTGWFSDSVQEFRTLCLDPREWINDLQWDVYNILSVAIGGTCFILCFLLAVMTGCIQCCYRSQMGIERQRGSRRPTASDGYEPLPPPYSRVEDTTTTLAFSGVISRTRPTGNLNPQQTSRDSILVHQNSEAQSTVDDLICLSDEEDGPSTLQPEVFETQLHTRGTTQFPTGGDMHIDTVTIGGDPSSYAVTAHVSRGDTPVLPHVLN